MISGTTISINQEVILKAAKEAIAFTRVFVEENEVRRIEELNAKEGVQIIEPVDESEFAELVIPNWPKFYKLISGGDAVIGEQLVKEVQEIASGNRKKLSDNLPVQ
jgi:TRAP-type C4-dicarboxylate transport system substrate-binding protein